MDLVLKRSLDNFVNRAKGTRSQGKTVDIATMNQLNGRLGNILPDWFIDLLSSYPISGGEIDFPLYEPEDDYDGCIVIEFAKTDDIVAETCECYPGLAIKERGYFCFGTDPTGGGDPFFIQYNKGDNPPVFQVYHDVSDEGEVIEKEGMEKIADSLSDFFDKARVV